MNQHVGTICFLHRSQYYSPRLMRFHRWEMGVHIRTYIYVENPHRPGIYTVYLHVRCAMLCCACFQHPTIQQPNHHLTHFHNDSEKPQHLGTQLSALHYTALHSPRTATPPDKSLWNLYQITRSATLPEPSHTPNRAMRFPPAPQPRLCVSYASCVRRSWRASPGLLLGVGEMSSSGGYAVIAPS